MPSPEELAANKRHAFSLNDGRKFTELYNVQHLQSAQLDSVSRVCISTIQRLYSMLPSLFFWIETRVPQRQITRGDRQRVARVQRSVWNDLGSALAS